MIDHDLLWCIPYKLERLSMNVLGCMVYHHSLICQLSPLERSWCNQSQVKHPFSYEYSDLHVQSTFAMLYWFYIEGFFQLTDFIAKQKCDGPDGTFLRNIILMCLLTHSLRSTKRGFCPWHSWLLLKQKILQHRSRAKKIGSQCYTFSIFGLRNVMSGPSHL